MSEQLNVKYLYCDSLQKADSTEAVRLNDLVAKLQEENLQLKKRVAYVRITLWNVNSKILFRIYVNRVFAVREESDTFWPVVFSSQVENLNAKWQKYDSSREEYVRGLCQRLKESTVLVAGSPAAGPALIGHGLGLASSSSGLLQQEITRLNNLLEDKMRDCERLAGEKDEIAKRDQERIQMLEQQVSNSPPSSCISFKRDATINTLKCYLHSY